MIKIKIGGELMARPARTIPCRASLCPEDSSVPVSAGVYAGTCILQEIPRVSTCQGVKQPEVGPFQSWSPRAPNFIIRFLGYGCYAVLRQLSFQTIKFPVSPSRMLHKEVNKQGRQQLGERGASRLFITLINRCSSQPASDSCFCQALRTNDHLIVEFVGRGGLQAQQFIVQERLLAGWDDSALANKSLSRN